MVGAGIAGLTAAATSAAGGASTLVLEAHRPGGRARTTEREGFTLNLGAHALYCGGAGGRVLADLGIVPKGSPPPLGRYHGSINGFLHELPTGPGSLLRTSLVGARSKVQLGRLLSGLPRMDPADLTGISAGGGGSKTPDCALMPKRWFLHSSGFRPTAPTSTNSPPTPHSLSCRSAFREGSSISTGAGPS